MQNKMLVSHDEILKSVSYIYATYVNFPFLITVSICVFCKKFYSLNHDVHNNPSHISYLAQCASVSDYFTARCYYAKRGYLGQAERKKVAVTLSDKTVHI